MRLNGKNKLKSHWFTLKSYSIKQLTIAGFSLVALPLIFSLIFSAVKVNHLSQQGTEAIFDVAHIIKSNRELNSARIKMERFASQFVVLNDDELKQAYKIQTLEIMTIIDLYTKAKTQSALQAVSHNFLEEVKRIEILMQNKAVSLNQLQVHFSSLAELNNDINRLSNAFIEQQAIKIKLGGEQVSSILLNSLIIIPLVLIIAILFIRFITTPLHMLTDKIQQIEHGHFNENITADGSIEITNITNALELMRTRLHALELQKSSFIRHISHELKTPLAAIREGAELLYDNSVGELTAEQQEISEIIRASVNKLQRLIEDLLNFNVVLDSTSLQDSEKLILNTELASVLQERKLNIKRKNLTIDLHVPEITIYSNSKQLNVILDNLLSNAIKYSPENATILIQAEIRNSCLSLSITDQGIGIPTTQKLKIFDAFYQGTPPQDQTIKGSGLGLTIVKELIMRLNGEIEINSQTTQPSGTKVTLNLPRAVYVKALQNNDEHRI